MCWLVRSTCGCSKSSVHAAAAEAGGRNLRVSSSAALESLHSRAGLETCKLWPPALGACKKYTHFWPQITPSARFPCISTIIGCHMITQVYQFETIRAHSYHWWLERTWQFDTTWDSPFQQNYTDLSHTFWCTLGNASGWWDDRWRNHKPVLLFYFSLDIQQSLPCTFLPSPISPQLFGPNHAS